MTYMQLQRAQGDPINLSAARRQRQQQQLWPVPFGPRPGRHPEEADTGMLPNSPLPKLTTMMRGSARPASGGKRLRPPKLFACSRHSVAEDAGSSCFPLTAKGEWSTETSEPGAGRMICGSETTLMGSAHASCYYFSLYYVN